MERRYSCKEVAQLYGVKIITVWSWIRSCLLYTSTAVPPQFTAPSQCAASLGTKTYPFAVTCENGAPYSLPFRALLTKCIQPTLSWRLSPAGASLKESGEFTCFRS